MIDDRDRQLLSFLKENAGRFYTAPMLSKKYGYSTKGGTSTIRRVLKRFLLEENEPVVSNHFGFGYVLNWYQVAHYRVNDTEKRIAALTALREAEIRLESEMKKKQTIEVRL